MPAEISVVIPTFRRPLLLKQAIESALAQHVPVEVIVVDDSPERSADPVVPSPSGGWPSRVRNLGCPTRPLL
ncbi:glycosyltransferase family 2 protein [Bradyrhizobium sp.]|uniref:glycosyltransferase family 2 protein n=1 Tax=Bradyrhizobium sp. TaxID=376 RepID=UPI003C6FFEBA